MDAVITRGAAPPVCQAAGRDQALAGQTWSGWRDARDGIVALAADAGLSVVLRQADPAAWSAALARCAFQPLSHTAATLDYLLAYHGAPGQGCIDASLLLLSNRQPLALLPMLLRSSSQDGRCAVTALQLQAPIFCAATGAQVRKLVGRCLDLADMLCRRVGLPAYESTEPFQAQWAASEWYLQALQRQAHCERQHELYMELGSSPDAILSRLGQTTRYEIKRGRKFFVPHCIRASSPAWAEEWQAFRQLHLAVSGRQTRSDATWDQLAQQIVRDEAFLITLRDADGRLVGGGFFRLTPSEAEYAVAVYDRALFDKPLGHLVQFEAMREMVARGIAWYRIGQWPLPGDQPPPSEKELSIARFKRNFASAVLTRQRLTHPVA
jgi:FemAB family protein